MRQLVKIWSHAKQLNAVSLYPHEEHVLPILLRLASRSKRLLEVGAGKGRMLRILRERGLTSEFYAVDITKNIIYCPAIGVQSDARALPFKNDSFDLVYSLGVLEHFPETLQGLREHARVAKPDGYVLVTVPHVSLSGLYSKVVYFFNKLLMRYSVSYEIISGRRISMLHLQNTAKHANLDLIALRALPPTLPYGWRLKRLELIARKILPWERWGAYLFLLAKKL